MLVLVPVLVSVLVSAPLVAAATAEEGNHCHALHSGFAPQSCPHSHADSVVCVASQAPVAPVLALPQT